jgi:L-threonylcarbamoyladenylate synthase
MNTQLLPTSTPLERAAAVDAAVRLLHAGEVVALPTETVYGLAADATRADAVVKIFEAKERPFFDPLIVHLPAREWLYRIAACDDMMITVEELTGAFWPGPLTLVLPRWQLVPDIVTAGLDTVAIRMSAHPVFSEIVRSFGKPLAAPSANRFGRISPTTGAHVVSELEGRIPLVVDAGPSEHGLESTIVAVEPGRLRLLRAGPVSIEELETFSPVEVPPSVGKPISPDQIKGSRRSRESTFLGGGIEVEERPEAPGQLASHYAPRTPLFVHQTLEDGYEKLPPSWSNETGYRRGLLAWRSGAPDRFYDHVEVLSATGDLREAAASLFAKLRRLDELGLDIIFAEEVPETGLGVAIMDRLRKAAHA